ncbi:unnamed protein product [Ectocarpus fasciculatus]
MSAEKHLYAIQCLDDQSCGKADGEPRGGSTKRMGNYPAHKEYQAATANPEDPRFINKVSAGPLVNEVDDYMIGSFFLVAATREEAQNFVDNDPFKKEGVWSTISFERYVSVVGVKPHSGNL